MAARHAVEVIEQNPERLQEVDGIGPKRAESIVAAWADQKAIREIMIFLHSQGVGTSRAVRIFKTYGAATPFASSPKTRTGSRATSAASASKAPIRSPGNLASRRRG